MILIAVFSWVHGPSELQVSTYHADRFDQPKPANSWLQMCKAINGRALAEVNWQRRRQALFHYLGPCSDSYPLWQQCKEIYLYHFGWFTVAVLEKKNPSCFWQQLMFKWLRVSKNHICELQVKKWIWKQSPQL